VRRCRQAEAERELRAVKQELHERKAQAEGLSQRERAAHRMQAATAAVAAELAEREADLKARETAHAAKDAELRQRWAAHEERMEVEDRTRRAAAREEAEAQAEAAATLARRVREHEEAQAQLAARQTALESREAMLLHCETTFEAMKAEHDAHTVEKEVR
jgi:hypothetical protein